jgi:hypothetical protein
MCLNKTYGKITTGKHLSDMFSIRSGLTKGDALPSLLLNSFRKCHLEGPGEPVRTKTEWETSDVGLLG